MDEMKFYAQKSCKNLQEYSWSNDSLFDDG